MPVIHHADTPNESTEAVNVYRTSAICPSRFAEPPHQCSGTLVADGYAKTKMTPLGPAPDGAQLLRHTCTHCTYSTWFEVAYPRVHYTPASIPVEDQLRQLMAERAPKG